MLLAFRCSSGDNAVMPHLAEPLRYRLITGPDDAEFCARISSLLEQGYRLYGSPAVTFNGSRVIAAQALVLAGPAEVVAPVANGE
jgi:hypothetical protein